MCVCIYTSIYIYVYGYSTAALNIVVNNITIAQQLNSQ